MMNWPWPMSLLWRGSVGRRGERAAAGWLRGRGYRILHRNIRVGRYEADLIALDPDGRTIAIVEVKTRRATDQAAPPEERIDRNKKQHLAALAARLKRRKQYADAPIRFDAIAVIMPERGAPVIRHIPAAFDSPF